MSTTLPPISSPTRELVSPQLGPDPELQLQHEPLPQPELEPEPEPPRRSFGWSTPAEMPAVLHHLRAAIGGGGGRRGERALRHARKAFRQADGSRAGWVTARQFEQVGPADLEVR